jgi:hypothetical protein
MVKKPTNGAASIGPMNIVSEKSAIASSRVSLL